VSTNAAENAPEAIEERRSFSLGKYYLFARLGTGGMADAYLAVARGAMNVTKLAVVKRLREEHASDPDAREMFLNEARLAARLNHPNVIQTFEAGSEGGCYFIAMEYVDGQPLSRLLTRLRRKGRKIDPTIAARICSHALEGLHHAHELVDFDGTPLQMIHRDVSPQNIMVTYDGRVKVLDFGIAKAVGTTQTAHGVFKGKMAFMAPEQLVGEKVDRRADLFSMGVCLWEAVTGARLLADETPAKTLFNLMNKRLPPASEINPDVPEQLSTVLAKALERNPEDRYASAYDMHVALEEFVRSAGRVITDHDVRDVPRQLFGDIREKLQAQIREHVGKISSQVDSERVFLESQVRTLGTSALLDLSDMAEQDGTRTNKTATLHVATTSNVSPAPRKRAPLRPWVAVGIAAMLGSGVAFVLLMASGVALLRSQNIAPRSGARLNPAPAQQLAPTPIAETSTTASIELPPDPPPGLHASPSDDPMRTATAPAKAAPVRAPARPAPAAQKAAPASSVETPAQGASTPAQTASPASSQPATPAEPTQGRVFRREL